MHSAITLKATYPYIQTDKSNDMELVEVLHMNGGDGESSYAENSVVQRKLIEMSKPVKEEAIKKLYSAVFPVEDGAVVIADLGCSTGPNALMVACEFIAAVDKIRRESGHDSWSPEFQVFLNDLPGNDFNSIFRALPQFHQKLKNETRSGFGSCFVNGVPGSFYGRLFPTCSLHFVHASSTLHWLSQVPKGIERSKGLSAESVGKAYTEQWQSDFSKFLECRAEEMVTDGYIVFTLTCRRDELPANYDECFSGTWKILDKVFDQLLAEGLIEEEKVNTFNRPLYAPSWGEIESEVHKQGSFTITNTKSYELSSWDIRGDEEQAHKIHSFVLSMRSGTESFLVSHFGPDLSINELFRRYEEVARDTLTEKMTRMSMMTVAMTKTR